MICRFLTCFPHFRGGGFPPHSKTTKKSYLEISTCFFRKTGGSCASPSLKILSLLPFICFHSASWISQFYFKLKILHYLHMWPSLLYGKSTCFSCTCTLVVYDAGKSVMLVVDTTYYNSQYFIFVDTTHICFYYWHIHIYMLCLLLYFCQDAFHIVERLIKLVVTCHVAQQW